MSEEMQLALEHTLKTMRKLKEAKAEIERLSEANEMMLTDIRRTDVDMLEFKAEIERLRAALERISSYTSNPAGSGPAYTYCGEMVRIARAALAEEKPND